MKPSFQKYIDELQSIDLDMNWYVEDGVYQKIIYSQVDSILERLDWHLRKNSRSELADQIQKSLSRIQNISGQLNFLIEILSEEQKSLSDTPVFLSNLQRIELINKVAYYLQGNMVTTEINTFLSGFNVKTEDVSMVQS